MMCRKKGKEPKSAISLLFEKEVNLNNQGQRKQNYSWEKLS
jgi:hypothetical protein